MPKVKTESITSKMMNNRANSFSNNSVSSNGIKNVSRTQSSSSSSQSVDELLQGLGAEPLSTSVRTTTTQGSQESQKSAEVFNSLLNRLSQNPKPDLQLSFNSQPLAPNPISILNELHQSLKGLEPPKYDYINELYGFICELEVFGKVYKSSTPRGRKQEAKEDAALIAVNDITKQEGVADILSKDLLDRYNKEIRNAGNEPTFITKSQAWYQKQESEWPNKKPRTILLEFCQMHHLPLPTYAGRHGPDGLPIFDCVIGERVFKSDRRAFVKVVDAKDYVASKAFTELYEEQCESERKKERVLKKNSFGLRRPDASSATVDSLRALPSINENQTESSTTNTNSVAMPSRPAGDIDTVSLVLPALDEGTPKIKEELRIDSTVPQPPIDSTVPQPPIRTDQSLVVSASSPSSNNFHPYHPSIYAQRSTQSVVPVKKYISLLCELCQSKRWSLPIFNLQNSLRGFMGTVTVNKHTFKGNVHSKKSEAKESVAEVAYKYFTGRDVEN
ncbi:13646_t:CDS:1 [Acaulospora morrowiae]|uniref:13646_t:CDS:1 n=1 Tax=Acaulospora morrowiae TaxID=94023 RepID=A0A9N9A8V1_9GLOM|nr:13646_t:CDS:1 [Acaulospora morrowiae]